MLNNQKTFTHPSFGQLQVSRCYSGEATPLYGSSIEQRQTIRITLKHSEMNRNLNKTWYHGHGKTMFEVELSQTQWAEFISSLNIGDGVPCTIRIDENGEVEPCPPIPTRQLFDNEFRETVEHSTATIQEAIKQCSELMEKKNLTKADRSSLLEYLQKIKKDLTDVIPFIQKSFTKQMDQTVHEAKGEIEAIKENYVLTVGRKVLGEEDEKEVINLSIEE